jgi:membrane protein implicated in regulation of membrane protease activity
VLLVWLVLGIVLLLFELHHLAFYALFVAVGAFAAAAAAGLGPDAYLAQGAVAVGVSIFGVVAIRPYAQQMYQSHRHPGKGARGVHGGLVGAEALTLDEVGDVHHVGHVRLAGERWLAVSGGDCIAANTRVVVTQVQGTTLTVWPTEVGPIAPHELGREGSGQ